MKIVAPMRIVLRVWGGRRITCRAGVPAALCSRHGCTTNQEAISRSPLCAVAALAIVLHATFPQAWAAPPANLEEVVDSIATDAIKSGSTVGLSIAIAKGADIVLAKGYGLADFESEVPATAETVYRIGSITKQFTAAAILLLMEEEKIGIDDPLTKFLSDYPTQGRTVTIRHLLQHTSGIKSFTDLPSYRKQMRLDVSHDDILNRFKDEPFHFAPGENYRYCNSGYYLLGVILEQVAERSFEEFLQQRIFSPLQLKRTFYDRHARIIPHRARGYSRWGGELSNARYLSMTQPFAAGALASTVGDLVRWQRALLSNELLTASSYKLMTTAGTLTNGTSIDYGLGTFLRKQGDHATVGHGGGINEFRSELVYYPENDYTIVVLANSGNAQPAQITKGIAGQLFGVGQENANK